MARSHNHEEEACTYKDPVRGQVRFSQAVSLSAVDTKDCSRFSADRPPELLTAAAGVCCCISRRTEALINGNTQK